MRILGLDLGSKTIGIASSDLTKTVATMVKTITFKDHDFNKAIGELEKAINFAEYGKIVLGLPKNMDGSLGFQAQETLVFKKMLEDKFELQVILWDERLTSKMANAVMISADISRKKRKKKVDYIAATIILQSYLDSRK